MTARAPNGRFTAERTTTETTTTSVTERITLDYGTLDTWADGTIPGPIGRAPGWDGGMLTGRWYRAQRAGQRDRCLQFLIDAVESGEMTAAQTGSWDTFAHQLPGLVRSAVVILRAGPAATPLELHDGRSI